MGILFSLKESLCNKIRGSNLVIVVLTLQIKEDQCLSERKILYRPDPLKSYASHRRFMESFPGVDSRDVFIDYVWE